MPYEVTATRKRPSSFDALAGQEFVVATVKNSIKTGHVAHAYLFSGPRGVGKTSAARILAKALNCEKGPTPDPCGICSSCTEIARGNAMDVIEIDGASNTSVNDVREIKDEVLFAPNSSRYKVYIIDEVHMLSNSAFNALLKTIEEPPPYIVFIFATTEIHKVPATIRSRCQQFNFRLIPLDTIKGLLRALCEESGISAEDDALLWIAKEATGSLRDAYTLFDQVLSFSEGEISVQKIREKMGLVGLDRINEIAELFASENAGAALALLDDVLTSGVSIEQFTVDLAEYFRNILFLKSGIHKESLLGYSPERFSKKVRETFSSRQVEKALALLLELYRNLRYSLDQRFEIELAVSRLADLKNFLSREQLSENIRSLRKELKSGFTIQGGPAVSFSEAPEGSDVPLEDVAEGPSFDENPAGDVSGGAGGISAEKKKAVVQNLRKKKLALSSALEKSGDWIVDGDRMVIHFDTKFSADFVNQDLSSITAVVREVLGRDLRISVQTGNREQVPEAPAAAGSDDDERMEIAKKVFRGEVLR
jgi:DNA polymerase-3 subunit gamma/tau